MVNVGLVAITVEPAFTVKYTVEGALAIAAHKPTAYVPDGHVERFGPDTFPELNCAISAEVDVTDCARELVVDVAEMDSGQNVPKPQNG
jgi:hypothetical protein